MASSPTTKTSAASRPEVLPAGSLESRRGWWRPNWRADPAGRAASFHLRRGPQGTSFWPGLRRCRTVRFTGCLLPARASSVCAKGASRRSGFPGVTGEIRRSARMGLRWEITLIHWCPIRPTANSAGAGPPPRTKSVRPHGRWLGRWIGNRAPGDCPAG